MRQGLESGAARTRTWNQRIMSPHVAPLNPEENADSGEGAAHSTALETAKAPIDPELAQVIEAWDTRHRRSARRPWRCSERLSEPTGDRRGKSPGSLTP
jgi:hypothetical protein